MKPDCETYQRCGGCDLRHMKYETTLNLKRNTGEPQDIRGAVVAEEYITVTVLVKIERGVVTVP